MIRFKDRCYKYMKNEEKHVSDYKHVQNKAIGIEKKKNDI